MGIVVDFIIVAIILLSTFLAYRKGLVKLAIGLFTFIISVVLTFVLYQPISNLIINGTGIDEMLEDAIYEKANDIMQENEEDSFTGEIIEQAKNEMLPETARTLSINIVKGRSYYNFICRYKNWTNICKIYFGLSCKITSIKSS